MKTKAIALLCLMSAQLSLAATAPSYEELLSIVQGLQNDVKRLSGEVETLKTKNLSTQNTKQQDINTVPTNAVTVGSSKDTFRLPDSKTSLGFGGFMKLDSVSSSISMGENKSSNQYLSLNAIPVGDSRKGLSSITTIHPRESRMWFKSTTPAGAAELNTYLEIDFFATGDTTIDPYRPRIRHAYGTYNGIIAGQTWSTFTNIDTYPESLDFGAKLGASLSFAPMLGYRKDIEVVGMPMWFQVALEEPKTNTIKASDATTASQSFNSVPDLAFRTRYRAPWGELSVALLARQLRMGENGNIHEAHGGAANITTKINLGRDGDNVRFGLTHGNTVGRYTANGAFADAVIDSSNNIRPLSVTATYLALQHWWSPTLRSNFIANVAQADNPSYMTQNATKKAVAGHLNLMYNPIPQALFGAEFIYGLRQLEDRREGDIKRVQISTRFNF